MGLTIVALLLFLAMVAAWVVLPGSMLATPMGDISVLGGEVEEPATLKGGVTAPAS